MFAVVANGCIHHNRSEPGLERQRSVVRAKVLKNFQETLIQHIVGLIDVGHVPQTHTFGVAVILPE